MRLNRSHAERNSAKMVIATMVVIALVSGAALAAWISQKSAQQAELMAQQSLTQQVGATAGQLAASIASLEALAQAMDALPSAQPPAEESESHALGAGILHWSRLTQTTPASDWGVDRSLRNPEWASASGGLARRDAAESSYLHAVLSKLRSASPPPRALLYQADPQRSLEWIIFLYQKSNSRVLALLVDPARAFPLFEDFGKLRETQGHRIYLIGAYGKVLAHSQKGFVGSNFSGANVFREGVQRLLSESQAGSAAGKIRITSGEHESIDRHAVSAAYARFTGYPFAIVQESFQSPSPAIAPQWGALLGALGILILAGMPIANHMKRLRNTRPRAEAWTPPMTHAPMPTPSPPPKPSASATPIVVDRRNLANELTQQFELKAAKLQDPSLVISMMTQTASRIADSPALFFRYNPARAIATLETDAGFENGKSPASMSFPLAPASVQRIFDCVRDGSLASLANYGPLAELLLERQGVACFEAWAITYGKGLVGILVILQSNAESASQRDLLVRMMNTAAHLYEHSRPNA